MTPLSRRELFKGLSAFGMTAALQNLLSPARMLAQAQATNSYKALVCIVLDGGCDSNSMVVPLDRSQYALYQAARPYLAVSQNALLPFKASSGSSYGINPDLPSIASMVQSGKCSVVANVGPLTQPLTKEAYLYGARRAPTNLMNHEIQKVQWGTCFTDTSAISNVHTGWGGRMADALSSYSTGIYPVVTALDNGIEAAFCMGEHSHPAMVTVGGGTLPDAALAPLQQFSRLPSGSRMVTAVANGLKQSVDQEAALRNALTTSRPLQTTFPATSLGAQLGEVAKVMGIHGALGLQRQIFMVQHSGFDTHAQQPANLPTIFAQLDAAIAAFQNALAEMGISDQVLTFTTSDFNRSLLQNSSGGSDHAWGGHQLVFGGSLKSGGVVGTFQDMTLNGPDDFMGTGCWIPTTSVDQYGATLASWMGVPDKGLAGIFPNLQNFATQKLGFV